MTSSSHHILNITGLCLLVLHVVSCFSLDLDELSKYADKLADGTNESENEYNLNKNAATMAGFPVSGIADKRTFSITGDLQALADMLYYDDRGKGLSPGSPHRSALLELGKRNWRTPLRVPHLSKTGEIIPTDSNSDAGSVARVLQRRSQQLSVSGPLSALANMLATEGRRRLHSESSSNRMRLLQMGKRADSEFQYSRGPAMDSSERF